MMEVCDSSSAEWAVPIRHVAIILKKVNQDTGKASGTRLDAATVSELVRQDAPYNLICHLTSSEEPDDWHR
jgi:hypothetical protein